MANSTDSFIPIQDPPEISIGTLYQFFGTGDVSRVTDRLYPTASSTTARVGFTSAATDSEVSTESGDRATFDIDRTPTTDQNRVPDGGGIDTAPIYQQKVTVETNGPIGSIERIGLCILNSQDSDVQDGDGFQWYDASAGANDSNDVERNCGFSDEDPTDEGQMVDARAGIAIIYDVSDDTFRLNDTTTQHQIVLPTSRDTTRTADELYGSYADFGGDLENESGSIEVYFAFRPSHALAKASDGWIIRAAAQDRAPSVDPGTGEEDFDPQVSQIFYGQSGVDSHSEGELTNSSNAFRDEFTTIAVAYYGAMLTDREDVNYGTLGKGDSKVVNSIDAGRYIANSQSKIWIDATDFTFGGDTLTLVDSSAQDGQVILECSYSDDFADATEYSSLAVLNQPKELTEDDDSTTGILSPTIEGEDSEASAKVAAEGMSCQLTYGGGAENAAQSYTNTVSLNIADNG